MLRRKTSGLKSDLHNLEFGDAQGKVLLKDVAKGAHFIALEFSKAQTFLDHRLLPLCQMIETVIGRFQRTLADVVQHI